MGDIHHLCNSDDRNETTIDMCLGCGSIWESSIKAFFSKCSRFVVVDPDAPCMEYVFLSPTSSYDSCSMKVPRLDYGAMFGYSPRKPNLKRPPNEKRRKEIHPNHKCVGVSPWKINGWNIQITHFFKGK